MAKKIKKNKSFGFYRYRNPDKRCGYPFTNDPLGYCWSYANHIDGSEGFEDMKKICVRCNLWSIKSK